jgi:hypothetical protein
MKIPTKIPVCSSQSSDWSPKAFRLARLVEYELVETQLQSVTDAKFRTDNVAGLVGGGA